MKKFNIKKINTKIFLIGCITIFALLIVALSNSNFLSKVTPKFASTEEEVELDNWSMELFFLDSSVDNGDTPLQKIDWNIEEKKYSEDETRIIKVQINYKNTNAVTTYQPGELVITIPNLIYSDSKVDGTSYSANWTASVVVGANDPTHIGEDWTLFNGTTSPTRNQSTYTFTNAKVIEEKANFEGAIQITYTIKSNGIKEPPKYKPESNYSYSTTIKATLNDIVESNDLDFDYKRKYSHPWQKREFTVYKSASKITSFDGLGKDYDKYTWVKYTLSNDVTGDKDNYIGLKDYYMTDQLPTDCKVLSTFGKELETENGLLTINKSTSYSFYVGYPKDIYNEDNNNLVVKNKVDLYGTYSDETESQFLSEKEISLNLNDFEFEYDGDLYGVSKRGYTPQEMSVYTSGNYNLMYQSIIKNDGSNYVRWIVNPSVVYTGTPLTVRVGDDLIYRTDKDNKYIRSSDDEYYYSSVYIPCIYNGNYNVIPKDTYNITLYVRYAGNSDYVQYGESFFNHSKVPNYSTYYNSYDDQAIIFKEDEKVVGWYVQIDDMEDGISSFPVKANMKFIAEDILETGTIYNFAYLNVFSKDDVGNLTLLNEVAEENYKNFITKDEILKYDQEQYGAFMQRATTSKNWSPYKILSYQPTLSVSKSSIGNIVQNSEKEFFQGAFNVRADFSSTSRDSKLLQYFDQLTDDDFLTDVTLYDLLPKGMEITSDENEIKESLLAYGYPYDKSGKQLDSTAFMELIKKNTTIKITKNWNKTGRDRLEIKIDFSERPLLFLGPPKCSNSCAYGVSEYYVKYTYNYKIPYDSIIEYGNVYTNNVYAQSTNPKVYSLKYSSLQDNGASDPDAVDITEDGSTEDKLISANATVSVSSTVSAHQDVTTYVQTDKSSYSTGFVDSSNDVEYDYKLRVRTGSSSVTNLVIYDTLENARPERDYWKGEFVGVDTTHAESQGYKVKVYYSESENVGYLSDDGSWKEYNDSVDKKKVKSLAFEYFDEEGNKATLPSTSVTYVLIKMKSPSNIDINSIAYNDCWTQWSPIDPITKRPIKYVTGINSNIVKVALPNSVKIEDVEITVDKYWNDYDNIFGVRPREIKYKIVANGDVENAKEFTMSEGYVTIDDNNHWRRTVEMEKYDKDGNEIEYTIVEDVIKVENNYRYIPTIDGYTITNVLYKDIVVTKEWIDYNNYYSTRPSNIIIKVFQNGVEYGEINVTGDNGVDSWSGSLTVPVRDENAEDYIYTLEEMGIESYEGIYDNNTFTFTNTLVGYDPPVVNPDTKPSAKPYSVVKTILFICISLMIGIVLYCIYRKNVITKI